MPDAGYDEERYGSHRKLVASDIGLGAPRSCTNIVVLFLFLCAWALMIVVAAAAWGKGDLERLLNGVDYLGNVCGKGSPHGVASNVASDWGDRTSLFYPVGFDTATRSFNVYDALKLGVCLSRCPAAGERVSLYGTTFFALFPSARKFGRCVPLLAQFDCSALDAGDRSKCNSTKDGSGSYISRQLDLDNTAERSFGAIKHRWWVILVAALLAGVIAFVWLFVLRRLVKPVVVVTIALVFLALVVVGGVLYYQHHQLSNNGKGSTGAAKWYLAGAILCWIGAFLYTCVCVFLWKDVMVACDIIEEASKIPIQLPTMVLVPPVQVLLIVPLAIFTAFAAAEIHTSSSLKNVGSAKILGYNTTETVAQYKGEDWRTVAQIYNVFIFLWTVGFIHAIGFMTLAFCGVFWYWSARGDEKTTEHGVLTGAHLTARYHMGTLALGSLIIAIVQMFRLALATVQHRMRGVAERADTVKVILCCVQCLLACFERFLQFINKNAYILCCMTGDSFLPSARHAFALLVRNALSVGAVTIVGEYVMILGKMLITAVSVLFAYLILTSLDADRTSYVVVLIAVGVIAYFVACVFVNVFGVCIDTVLLSYCYDLEQNDGLERPYYFPSDLAKHVESAQQRARETNVKRQQRDLAKPLQ